MNNYSILTHIKEVAKDDLRVWAAPFVAIYRTAKNEIKRPNVNGKKHQLRSIDHK
ncbi:hypothetical protein QN372_19225 [Undibacterium sp. RTI2.1]|uniref:hypothetical protein n=1 Tax=unclassified Undibacterium TaxID=2630295 RepID=UPI002B23D090|nr:MULTISPECIES: hypothetical protein [unclassified Undibacterium]MEB0032885.1 hypothetical protein [Undibacterium sp. RTI2.1]MEB0118790.1 hypothetical protein [Undibacterium sp. RTI2.2]